MVFGDDETGKTNALRLMIRAIIARYTPEEARIMVADPAPRLLTTRSPEAYRVGYVVDSDGLFNWPSARRCRWASGCRARDLSPEQLARRDWWEGPPLFVLIDDYDPAPGAPGGLHDGALGAAARAGPATSACTVVARASAGSTAP